MAQLGDPARGPTGNTLPGMQPSTILPISWPRDRLPVLLLTPGLSAQDMEKTRTTLRAEKAAMGKVHFRTDACTTEKLPAQRYGS